jgi:hypothetical protein
MGRNAVLAREYAVPTHTNASRCKSAAMVGSAVDTVVSSSAETKRDMQMEAKMSQKVTPLRVRGGNTNEGSGIVEGKLKVRRRQYCGRAANRLLVAYRKGRRGGFLDVS